MDLEHVVTDLVDRLDQRHYGMYRGVVVDGADPLRLGRLRARVPSVLGPDVVTGWATPCTPVGGAPDAGLVCVPPRDAGVWVAFEEGDLEFPVWLGTYWNAPGGTTQRPDAGDPPDGASPPPHTVLRTVGGHSLEFRGGDNAAIVLRDGTNGHVLTLDRNGITVVDGVTTGNRITLSSTGITLEGAAIALGKGTTQPLVLGNDLAKAVTTFMDDLNLHTHPVSGAAAAKTEKSLSLTIPLSGKNTTA
jgi:hypothetical protein